VSEIVKLSSPDTSEFWKIPILFEDRHLLALDKPAGLAVSPDRHDPQRPNLMKLLHATWRAAPLGQRARPDLPDACPPA